MKSHHHSHHHPKSHGKTHSSVRKGAQSSACKPPSAPGLIDHLPAQLNPSSKESTLVRKAIAAAEVKMGNLGDASQSSSELERKALEELKVLNEKESGNSTETNDVLQASPCLRMVPGLGIIAVPGRGTPSSAGESIRTVQQVTIEALFRPSSTARSAVPNIPGLSTIDAMDEDPSVRGSPLAASKSIVSGTVPPKAKTFAEAFSHLSVSTGLGGSPMSQYGHVETASSLAAKPLPSSRKTESESAGMDDQNEDDEDEEADEETGTEDSTTKGKVSSGMDATKKASLSDKSRSHRNGFDALGAKAALAASNRFLDGRRAVFSSLDELAMNTTRDVAMGFAAELVRSKQDAPDAAGCTSNSDAKGDSKTSKSASCITIPDSMSDMTKEWYEENCESGHQDALRDGVAVLCRVGSMQGYQLGFTKAGQIVFSLLDPSSAADMDTSLNGSHRVVIRVVSPPGVLNDSHLDQWVHVAATFQNG